MAAGTKVRFTVGRVEEFACPDGKGQAFLWNSTVPGMGVRATPGGRKTYVFSARLKNGEKIRVNIGPIAAYKVPEAEERAREVQRMIDAGRDPRQVIAETIQRDTEARSAETKQALLVRDVWDHYVRDGAPARKDDWSERYKLDMQRAVDPGGKTKRRGNKDTLTKPGHLYALLSHKLSDFGADTGRDVIDRWFRSESKRAKVQATRQAAMFAGFLSWVSAQPEYRGIVDPTCARTSSLRDAARTKRRVDCIEIEQLPVWFGSVAKLTNRTAAGYLITTLLTGARRQSIAELRWTDIDLQWDRLTIKNKCEPEPRVIPLTPYLRTVLEKLPRQEKCEWVFAAASESGHIVSPNASMNWVCRDAEIQHVTIHGLRRTYSLLGEAAGAPAGAIAQIMGHKPSGVAEGYRPRSLTVLRPIANLIEAYILTCAGIKFVPKAGHMLHVVNGDRT